MSGLRPRRASALATVALLLAGGGGVSGQSLLGLGGLGVPLDALDARSWALGGVSLGLIGPSLRPSDPAAAADLRTPGVALTFLPSTVDVESSIAESTASGNRFPLIGIGYPIPGVGSASVSFGSVFDQRWDVEVERQIDTGAGSARVTDRFLSDGGVSALRVGLARRVSRSLAVGVSVGRHLGVVDRAFTRRFDSLSTTGAVPDFTQSGSWEFSGTTVDLGAHFDFAELVRLAASLTWSGTLSAEREQGADGDGADFDLPVHLRLGGTAILSPSLSLVLGVTYADWSDLSGGPGEETEGQTVVDFGSGLEWRALRLLGRTTRLRIGYGSSDHPFTFQGDPVDESTWTTGLGIELIQLQDQPLARLDLSLERGDRSSATLEESFWRGGISLRIAGF